MCSRPKNTDFIYMGGTGLCRPMRIIFGSVLQCWYTSLNIKFGADRTFYVPKIPVQRFDYYGSYRILWTDEDDFWQCYLELVYTPKYQICCELNVLRLQYTDLITMGGTGSCGPMRIIFDIIQSLYTSLGIKFGANRTFHVHNIPVYRFDLNRRYLIEAYLQSLKFVALCVQTKS